VALNYSVLILNKLENVNIQKLMRTQAVAFIMISIFCIFAKAKLFAGEDKLIKAVQ
jgi:hypothetical protein